MRRRSWRRRRVRPVRAVVWRGVREVRVEDMLPPRRAVVVDISGVGVRRRRDKEDVDDDDDDDDDDDNVLEKLWAVLVDIGGRRNEDEDGLRRRRGRRDKSRRDISSL